jgi:hypothetical protein
MNAEQFFSLSRRGKTLSLGLIALVCFLFGSVGDLIEGYDSSGNLVSLVSLQQSPLFIAVQVPEPATWAMVAMGVGVVLGGLQLRLAVRAGV